MSFPSLDSYQNEGTENQRLDFTRRASKPSHSWGLLWCLPRKKSHFRCDAANAMLRGKFVIINIYILKEE
jgi:hypothetical protein